MRNAFYLILIASWFVSCKGTNKNHQSESTDSAGGVKTTSLLEQFKPFIQGAWVNENYLAEIAKTSSPFLARFKTGEITTMLIETSFITGDSIKIEVGLGVHEGGELMLKFQPGNTYGSIKAYSVLGPTIDGSSYSLKYNVTSKDTTLILYIFDKNKRLVDSTKYQRVFRDFRGHELGYALYYMVNKILVAGNYTLTDTLGNASSVSFDDYGNVAGFPDSKKYFIDVDFETPPGNNMDQIDFDPNIRPGKFFAFKIDHDTLNLYQTSFAKDSIDLILGKRVYKLVKRK